MVLTVVIICGVSGSGKTTFAKEITSRLNFSSISAEYIEADDFHPIYNIEKMKSGQPLQDSDRWPWLNSICSHINQKIVIDPSSSLSLLNPTNKKQQNIILACSALRKTYRDFFRQQIYSGIHLKFFMLNIDQEEIRQRMLNRKDHFMPESLLDSQFQTLELLDSEELKSKDCIEITKTDVGSIEMIIEKII